MPALDLHGYLHVEGLFRNDRALGFRAVRAADQRRVVLKCVAPGTTDPRARQRLAHEAHILSQLSLPGVVRAHGIELTALGPTLVLDDAGGLTLERAAGGPVPLPSFLDDAIQLARIIGGLHAAGGPRAARAGRDDRL